MPTAASIIEALQRRLRLTLRRDSPEPGEFPAQWQGWLDAQSARPGAVTGATAEAWMAVFVERPLAAAPRRTPALNRWQAFVTLWRQQWLPPEPEDRRLRWGAGVVSLMWHLLFGGLLVWLMYLQYFATRPPPPGETTVTMVEYVGKGTPAEPGGGAQQPSERPQPVAQAQPAEPSPPQPSAQPAPAEPSPPAQVAVAAPPTPQLQAQLPDVAVRDVPEPQLPPPTVEQPVMVSKETPDAPQVFVLPPTRKRVDDSVRAPQIQAAQQPLRSVDVPAPVQPPSLRVPQREIALPSVRTQPREVAVRDVPAPAQLPQLQVREVPQRPVETPQLSSTAPQVRVAEIPTPPTPALSPAPAAATPAPSAPAQAQTAAPSASITPSASAAATASSSNAKPAASAAPAAGPSAATPAPPAATAGAGPKPTPAPGSWSTPRRGDDWGDSARNRPGGPPGLYNPDGSVRIADAPGSASPGFPPGTVTQEIKNLDRAGTWLRRKPTDYEATTLDKYWRPDETLLAEWVRRSIKNVAIPIPGTRKSIQCSVALLMLGGGCGISDPNLNDQPAEARPPPDVPFKPHLQEDNGSVRPPPGG
ncbi:hypothetical protein J5226_15200 [Lysobacter sp. K5869]|uniref:hypothetical protein n=1 Tax=Lysobacter sp. K5869 TaxID=2820808 RepID=UPI001C063C47|nr:hypothetical protein [Lysobacter sp. K5869]QWP74992.1 hypothetical protein J5226_15200 [Lysobacter sp. K5869]